MSDAFDNALHQISAHIRMTMTPDERRDAADERQNTYLAIGLDDADVLYAISRRAYDLGVEDFDTFALGYARGFTGVEDCDAENDAFAAGYAAGVRARYAASPEPSVLVTQTAARVS